MPHAIRRVDVAGRDVTDYLQLLLRKAGYNLSTTAEKEVVRLIKEKACYVALNPTKEEKEAGGGSKAEEFRLPDGNVVRVSERLICFVKADSVPSLLTARSRTFPSTRDIVQPRNHWTRSSWSASSRCRFYQQGGSGSAEEPL